MALVNSKPKPALELSGVVKRYGSHLALDGFELSVAHGEALALVGPSGCGKTTALKLCNGLALPDEGSVKVDGTPLDSRDLVVHRRRTGYVIQEVGLLPHWSVEQNIATTLMLNKTPAVTRRQRVHQLLDAVGLRASMATKLPRQLSGGERQRVGIARALAAAPGCLLMDEPFGSLDPINRVRLRRLMRGLRREMPHTLLLVTHDLADALALADRVCVMRHGKLVESLASSALDRARDPWVREFLSAERNLPHSEPELP